MGRLCFSRFYMAMIHGTENTGRTFWLHLHLKIKEVANHLDNFFQSPKEDGYMKTAYGLSFLAGRKSVL